MSAITAIRQTPDDGLDALLLACPQLPPGPWAHVNALRADGHAELNTLTLPSLRDEAWRFTDLKPLTRMSIKPLRAASPIQAADIAQFELPEAAIRLVFVDGIHAPHLSSSSVDNGGLVVANLPEAMTAGASTVAAHLGRHQAIAGDIFTALNNACLADAAVILVPRDRVLTAPVHVLFVATREAVVSHPRCLLVAEPGSSVTLIEDYAALLDAPYLSNPLTEIVLAEGASVRHIRVQREGSEAFHIGSGTVSLGRSSSYQSVSVSFGARISRCSFKASLGEGAECTMDGLALVTGSQLADTHSIVDHTMPHGTARQLHKCIAGGGARAVFNGRIMVRRGAQQTDSVQMSRNLLLSSKARIDTQPQLEIFADDVKCAHGATVAPLDEEEVFYLNSRGLGDKAARELLTYAFGAEIIERIPVASLRGQLTRHMLAQTGAPS
ncbi:MAG: Fe-S cluster assembly protein SufD [Methyloversatilis sp.]|jgi:Fe-S cluster assembly protein SufD|nr:Fe-S cluster assembly protein SufD [Methyloversatilis sp.]MBP6194352.1 Fe-S cluster assembly protein SufD [Methyloversatilis sp.]MBP9117609.1 Fe-S cluster assembly protein SufD [Methyloversatilis sp.]